MGIDSTEWEQILSCETKVASRDLVLSMAEDRSVGATTVSASLAIAAAAGIKVFCTGGIGGVHLGSEDNSDISADLTELSKNRMFVVSS